MRVVAVALLVACGEPTETSSHALVGRVVDASGAPVVDQTVTSVEGRDVTDADGRFYVEWKPPSQHADWVRDGVWYSRGLRDDDLGAVVEVRLPATRAALLRCERAAPCDLQLVWDLGQGLQAKVSATCPHGEVVALAFAPEGVPVARCAAAAGRPEEQAPLVPVTDGFVLQDAPQAVRVEIHAEPGGPPPTCAVHAGGKLGVPTDDGAYLVEVSGRVVINARCDDRPATPRIVTVTGPTTVALEWSALGPDLDLGPWLPGGGPVVLEAQRIEEGESGWRVDVYPGADGLFHLPPLPAGTYRITAGASGPQMPPRVKPRPGSLALSALVQDPEGKIVGLQGTLVVGADAIAGALPVLPP